MRTMPDLPQSQAIQAFDLYSGNGDIFSWFQRRQAFKLPDMLQAFPAFRSPYGVGVIIGLKNAAGALLKTSLEMPLVSAMYS